MVGTSDDAIVVVPANEASWEDLQTVFGRGDPSRCQCQRFKLGRYEWTPTPVEERAAQTRDQTGCGEPEAPSTSGLVAYLGGEPVGWCAVEPRTAYPVLLSSPSPVAWKGRSEDKSDDSVWAVTCCITRQGFRHRGVSAALIAAAVGFARERGARALEGYSMITYPGKEITWGELFVGSRNSYADAGFVEVSHPTPRRAVMRIDF
ncbi:MAG: putative GCN5-related N-acetyltransferase [Frankiales bacterium]|nr:putative GCN5-related N-acetyltransferase [Frankiales bacterium]